MANCISYNCDDLQPHLLNDDCGDPILGGFSNAVIFDCDHTVTDFTNGTQVLANIAANRAWKVRNIKVGISRGAPTEIDALTSCGTQTLVNYVRTGTWVDGNVNNFNIEDFYNSIFRGRTFAAMILFECGNSDSKATLINPAGGITFRGDRIIPDNNNELQRFEADFTWKSKDMPTRINQPVGVIV